MSVERMYFKTSGTVFREFGHNIPNVGVAISEIIKNSYDADAKTIEIIMEEDQLIFLDDGIGFSREAIESFLTISSSDKRYNEINKKNKNRKINGSKGLGIYSLFKIGNVLEFDSVHEGKRRRFTINVQDIMEKKSLDEYPMVVTMDDVVSSNYTKLILKDIEKSKNERKNIFGKEESLEKMLYTIKEDKNFSVKYNGNNYVTKDVEEYVSDKLKNSVICKVHYSNNSLRFNDTEEIYFKNDTIFNVEINLIFFSFKYFKRGNQEIPGLFKNKQGKLTPIIYINGSILENYDIYNIEVWSSGKTEYIMRQQIGFIDILGSNLEFTPDRTNLVSSNEIEKLKEFLIRINKEIQKRASELKKEIVHPKPKDKPSEKGKPPEKSKPSEKDKSLKKKSPLEEVRKNYSFTHGDDYPFEREIKQQILNFEEKEFKIIYPGDLKTIDDYVSGKNKVGEYNVTIEYKGYSKNVNIIIEGKTYSKTSKPKTKKSELTELKKIYDDNFSKYNKFSLYVDFLLENIDSENPTPAVALVIQSFLEINFKLFLLELNGVKRNVIYPKDKSGDTIKYDEKVRMDISYYRSNVLQLLCDNNKNQNICNYYSKINNYKHNFDEPIPELLVSDFMEFCYPVIIKLLDAIIKNKQ